MALDTMSSPMLTNLEELTRSLEELEGELTIYARGPWASSSPAIAAVEPEDGALPEAASVHDLEYFLEVFVAREFLEGWQLSFQSEATPADRCARLIAYAENDA